MTKTINAYDARVRFGQMLKEVRDSDTTFFVKKRGKVAAVVLSPDDYLDLMEISQELVDPKIKKALLESQKSFELGETGTEEELFAILNEKQ